MVGNTDTDPGRVGRYSACMSLVGLWFLNWRQHLLCPRLPACMLCPRPGILNSIHNGSRAECLHELFEAQAASRPGAVAVCETPQGTSPGATWTFQMLNERANQLAHVIRAAIDWSAVENGRLPLVGVMCEVQTRLFIRLRLRSPVFCCPFAAAFAPFMHASKFIRLPRNVAAVALADPVHAGDLEGGGCVHLH
jgi:hypothetical protein